MNTMIKAAIPVYDINMIGQQKDLLIERLGSYLKKHYHHLHTAHRHNFYHLVLFTNGKGSHTIDFEKFKVKPFQIYFMVPGQVHSWNFEGEMDGFIVHFNKMLFDTFLQNNYYLDRFYFFQGNAKNGICQIPPGLQEEISDVFESLINEAGENGERSVDMIRIKLLEMFILVERNCTGRSSKNFPALKHTLLRNFQQLIEKHFRHIRMPKEYADLLYITPNHLNVLCQDMAGKTAGDLIRDRVLLEAKRLLTNEDLTVTEIAYDLNFQDNSYFNRFFKKYEGLTPEAFRKKFINQ